MGQLRGRKNVIRRERLVLEAAPTARAKSIVRVVLNQELVGRIVNGAPGALAQEVPAHMSVGNAGIGGTAPVVNVAGIRFAEPYGVGIVELLSLA